MKFIIKRIKYYYNSNPFILIWILNILFCDVFLIDLYLLFCNYPRISKRPRDVVHAVVIADPQLTDAYSYKQSPGLVLSLTEFYSDIYMIRNFKRIQFYLSPDVIVFVGDLMDGGREWEDDQYNRELLRFKKIFQMNPKTIVIGVAGNHDIGFGETIVIKAHDRFINTFGELNTVTRVANHSFVAVDTIGLSGHEHATSYINAYKFLESLDSTLQDPPERRILITHVPLWRPENVDCGPRRVTKPIRNIRGYQYQNLIQYPIASQILSIINPSLTMSGDDHDDCIYTHHVDGRNYLEHSIGTFSWLQGNIYPSFGVMSLLEEKGEPLTPQSPSFSLEICSLPAQLQIYEWYIVLAIMTLFNIAYAAWKWRKRIGSYQAVTGSVSIQYRSFSMYFLGKHIKEPRNCDMVIKSGGSSHDSRMGKNFSLAGMNQRSAIYWARSESIDLGITVTHQLSDKSMIRYPSLSNQKKASQQFLPKLRQETKTSVVANDSNDARKFEPSSPLDGLYQTLPKISSNGGGSKMNMSPGILDSDTDLEDMEWTVLQQNSLARAVLEACEHKDLMIIKVGKDQLSLKVPKAVLFQSITLEHIYNASRNNFQEKDSGLCLHSIPSSQHFAFILEHLNRSYLKQQKIDISMYKDFHIPSAYLIDVAEYAFYLELLSLVDHCVVVMARKIEAIHSITVLPEPLIQLVLKQLSVGSLFSAERVLAISQINLWREKYLKLTHADSSQIHLVKDSIDTYKTHCLQFYISQAIQSITNGGNSISTEKVFEILQKEGNLIREMNLCFGKSPRNLTFEFWKLFFEYCPSLSNISLTCSDFDIGIQNFLTSTYFATHRKLMISLIIPSSQIRPFEFAPLTPFCKSPVQLTTTPLKQAEAKKIDHLKLNAEAKFKILGGNTSKEIEQAFITQKAIPIRVHFSNEQMKSNQKIRMESTCSISKIMQPSTLIFPFITELHFSSIACDGMESFVQFLQSNPSNISIKNLIFSHTIIDMDLLLGLLYALTECNSIFQVLESFELIGVLKGSDDQILEASKLLGILISSCLKLEKLNLEDNSISTAGMRQICDALPNSKLSTLIMGSLNIMTVLSMISKWSQSSKNVNLSIQNCGLVPRTLCSFIPQLGCNLKGLNLSCNTIDQSFIDCLQSWLSFSTLEFLALSGCLGLCSFQFLVVAKHLKHVEINQADLYDPIVLQLAKFWSRGELLQISKWSFQNNHLTDKVVQTLKLVKNHATERLWKRGSLIEMDLKRNDISSACISSSQSKTVREGFRGIYFKF